MFIFSSQNYKTHDCFPSDLRIKTKISSEASRPCKTRSSPLDLSYLLRPAQSLLLQHLLHPFPLVKAYLPPDPISSQMPPSRPHTYSYGPIPAALTLLASSLSLTALFPTCIYISITPSILSRSLHPECKPHVSVWITALFPGTQASATHDNCLINIF